MDLNPHCWVSETKMYNSELVFGSVSILDMKIWFLDRPGFSKDTENLMFRIYW